MVSTQKLLPHQKSLTAEEMAALKRKNEITDAVYLIQNHERARQARLYYGDNERLHKLRKKATQGSRVRVQQEAEPEVQIAAATTIERLWRGYTIRQQLKRRERERRLLIS